MARLASALVALLISSPSATAFAQDGAALFEQNCAFCHTIGGGGDGAPDLKGVTARQSRAWIAAFILDPEGVVKRGDVYAAAMVKKYDGTVMAPTEGLTAAGAEAIIAHIEKLSGGAAPPQAAAPPAAPPVTADASGRGRALYSGEVRLANGGVACFSCHTAGSPLPGIDPGTLGPDLSRAVERLKGVAGLATWLTTTPSPVMRGVYGRARLTPDEARAIAAFVADRAAAPAPPGPPRWFFLWGGGLAAAAFVAIGATWRRRFRAVRRPLVARAAQRTHAVAASVTRQGFRSGGVS